jgi:hypothetical protein
MTSRLFLGCLVKFLGRRRLLIGTAILSSMSMAALGAPPPVAMAFLVVALGLALGQELAPSCSSVLVPRPCWRSSVPKPPMRRLRWMQADDA